jgi:hypothetical protein
MQLFVPLIYWPAQKYSWLSLQSINKHAKFYKEIIFVTKLRVH